MIVVVVVIVVLLIYIFVYMRNEMFTLLEYPLFKDVIRYENQDKTSGIELCWKECDGYCVEYGVTGRATCFPY